MSCSITGLQELVDKVSKLTDDRVVSQMQKKALEPVAKSILNEMKVVSPVSYRTPLHGRDEEKIVRFTYQRIGGYNIGLNNMNSNWDVTKGLWYQNWRTDMPNFHWFNDFAETNKKRWLEEARDNVKVALYTYLKRNS